MSVVKPNPREPWLTPRRGRVLFGLFLSLFGLFGLAGSINQFVTSHRRTAQCEAEIVSLLENPPGIFSRIFGTFKVTYRFSVDTEVFTESGVYDIAPDSGAAAVQYEPTRPKNNGILLPSREKGVVTLISLAMISLGFGMIWRNYERRRPAV